MTRDLLVVKLGGSHAASSLLRPWLDAIRRHAGHVVLVPGGGPFAAAVRAMQEPMGFDDAAAHDMALMAMSQYARALAGLGQGYVVAGDVPALHIALANNLVPVWSPWPMLRGHPTIPRSWDVTSDSLAVWLAGELGGRRVLLIKHLDPGVDRSLRAMVRDGLLDPALPDFAARLHGTIDVVGPGDLAAADSWIGNRSAALA